MPEPGPELELESEDGRWAVYAVWEWDASRAFPTRGGGVPIHVFGTEEVGRGWVDLSRLGRYGLGETDRQMGGGNEAESKRSECSLS